MNSVALKTHLLAISLDTMINQLPFVNHFALTILTEGDWSFQTTRIDHHQGAK
jgi:hypothetical protein